MLANINIFPFYHNSPASVNPVLHGTSRNVAYDSLKSVYCAIIAHRVLIDVSQLYKSIRGSVSPQINKIFVLYTYLSCYHHIIYINVLIMNATCFQLLPVKGGMHYFTTDTIVAADCS